VSRQTRVISFVESVLNMMSGYVLSLVIWQVIGPLFGYHVTLWDNFWITNIFTVVSILRSYVWRRFFNAGLHGRLVAWFGRRVDNQPPPRYSCRDFRPDYDDLR